jgi:glycosyltransferase involved in cell wall biosynthesis/SAM-dependent methyltransferase
VTNVAVVVPALNAAALLPDCLDAIRAQTNRASEILVVVAPSADGTLELARRLADVTVLENPAGDRGSALNIALAHSRADVLAFVDAQARIAPDYLERALIALEEQGAAVAGGPMRPVGRTTVGRAMALALQTGFGSGGSQFHLDGEAREVESVYLGVYRADLFDRVGWYNPALLRTEDDDLNWRIRAAGQRIWLDPAIRSVYLCRDTFAGIWRQYHGYGLWKVALATLRPGAIRLRHLVPAAFVLALLVGAVVSLLWWWPALPLLLAVYLMLAFAAVRRAPKGGSSEWQLYPLVTLTMHLGYGIGSLQGLVLWPLLHRRAQAGERRAAEARAEIRGANRGAALEAIKQTYQRYDDQDRGRLWDPSNRGYARMTAERDARLVTLLRRSLPAEGGRVLDLGCGTGELAGAAQAAGIPTDWTGADLRPEAVARAAASHPWAHFVEASGDALPFDTGAFDVVVASTLFSSLPTAALERDVAAEASRVLRPGGWLLWYDLRYDNPRNPAVHGLDSARVAGLFPGFARELEPMTLLPPLSRRLGPMTPVLYPLLNAVPQLRSHLIGRLRRPAD